jgi:hypothetical protein
VQKVLVSHFSATCRKSWLQLFAITSSKLEEQMHNSAPIEIPGVAYTVSVFKNINSVYDETETLTIRVFYIGVLNTNEGRKRRKKSSVFTFQDNKMSKTRNSTNF